MTDVTATREPATVRGVLDHADWPLLSILAAAIGARVAIILATPHFIPVTDAGDFDHIATTLANTSSWPGSLYTPVPSPTALRPPLFPAVLSLLYKIVGTSSEHVRWDAGRSLEVVYGVVSVWLVYLIGRRVWSRRVGIVAAAISAVWPPLVMIGSSLLSESLFVPIVLAAIWAALVYRDDRRLRWAIAAGAFAGLSALARGNGLLMIVPVWFLVWVQRPRWSREAVKPALAALAAMIVVLVPWTIRNYDKFHQFVPVTTETGYVLAGTYNATSQNSHAFPSLWEPPLPSMHVVFAAYPHDNEAQVDTQLAHQAFHYWRHHPVSLLDTIYWNSLRLLDLTGTRVERVFAGGEGYAFWLASLSVYVFWGLLAVLVVGLTVPVIRRRIGGSPPALWGPLLVIYLTTAPLIALTRYRAPADPFLLMLAALILVAGWDLLHESP